MWLFVSSSVSVIEIPRTLGCSAYHMIWYMLVMLLRNNSLLGALVFGCVATQ